MSAEATNIQYQRRGAIGTLRLAGVMDIFEAAALRDAACKALADAKAGATRVDLADVERLDLTAAQILIALGREITAAGRAFGIDRAPERLTPTLAWVGVTGDAH